MRVIYASKKGGSPLSMGMNRAKRVARAADARDNEIVKKQLGPGLPRQHGHHQQLVKQRQQYYGDTYAERIRPQAPQPAGQAADAAEPGAADTAVPEPTDGAAD